ncbi:MAG: hypothetical protein KA715_11480 [Xanthomonadaceae bacterium]|nr:hypothetical protein [Xanthomonadaceae bacterium]
MKTTLIQKACMSVLLHSLASCTSMMEAHKARICQKSEAYEEGFNDGRAGSQMDSSTYTTCGADSATLKTSYQDGYKAGSAQTSTPKVGDSFPNAKTVIQIGIGNNHKDSASNKAWFCETHAFAKTYSSYGATELEARNAAIDSCGRSTHRMHCDNEVSCRPNH